MKNHLVLLFIITLLLGSLFPSISYSSQIQALASPVEPSGTTIYVDANNTQGPWNGTKEYPYQHICDGILHATDGDTVYVFDGIYNETILVNKSISLRGQQQDETIIDGNNTGTVVQITRDDVRVRRFTIRNSGGFPGDAGISIRANRTTITECTIYRARSGITVSNQSSTTLSSCRFHTDGYGITCMASDYTTITSCIFYHNGIGVYLSETHVTTITNSYADTNGIGFYAEHSSNIEISASAARDNNDNEGGMFFAHSRFITITNCHLNHNGVGVDLINSSSCFIQDCNFTLNTHYACKLNETLSSIIFTNCIFTKNLRYGLYAEHSAFSITWSNIFDNENYGLYSKWTAVNAQYDWWGSLTGPAHTGLMKADRGIFDPREVSYHPWLTFPMPDIGPSWILNYTFQKPQYTNPWPEHITFSEPDSDNDGAPDSWEIKWGYDPLVWDDHYHLDPDNDSLNNIEECYMDQYNASPFHKDVFFELDWTAATKPNVTNEPPAAQIEQMIHAFAVHNITLHVDAGALGGGEEIPTYSFVTYADLIDLYWRYFLHGDMNNPRQRIFHYGLICDYTEGPGFVFVGWDNLNSFVYGLQFLVDNYPAFSRERLSVTSIMHEAGHTFNLIASRYTGIDNALTTKPYYKEFWYYWTYFSTLNYLYAASILNYSDGTHGLGDFDDWGHLEFSFFKNTHLEYPAT